VLRRAVVDCEVDFFFIGELVSSVSETSKNIRFNFGCALKENRQTSTKVTVFWAPDRRSRG
jgi:hypothetical protein